MQTTFLKIVRTIGVELLKSSILVVTSTVLSAALRRYATSASESVVQGARFVKNSVIDMRNKAA